MDATIAHFVAAVSALTQKRKLQSFIHPVCPVLEPTRAVVCSYNARYQRAVQSSPWLHWLDMFDDMLLHDDQLDSINSSTVTSSTSVSGSMPKLRPEFALDGTHLSPQPAYLPLLQRALEGAAVAALH
jgi:hypothetical protein